MQGFASLIIQRPTVPPRSMSFSTIAQYTGDYKQMKADELIGQRKVGQQCLLSSTKNYVSTAPNKKT
jgi:hypothetical protein